jgi:hypothetical protein
MSTDTIPAISPVSAPFGALQTGSFSTRANMLGSVLVVLYCSIIAIIALGFPLANWDMIPYTALAQATPGQDMASIHASAYDTVKQAVSPGDFLQLTEDRRYRIAQYASSDAFATMLPMYEVKWLYIEAVRAVAGFMGVIQAERAINSVAMIAVGLMITFWLNANRALVYAPIVIAGLALCDIGTVARITTPDMLAGAFVLGAILALQRKQSLIGSVLLMAAVATRPDHVLLAGCVAVALVLANRDWRSATLIIVPSLAAFALVSNVDNYPGWWTHVYLTQIEYVPTLEGFRPQFSLATYIFAVVKAGSRAIAEEGWPVLLLMLILGSAWVIHKIENAPRHDMALIIALLVAVMGKFLIFPINEGRFHFAYLVPALLLLVAVWANSQARVDLSEKRRAPRDYFQVP